jgi:hypothetical protein
MCVYTHILHHIETLVGQKKKIWIAVNTACQGNISPCHFGYARYNFVSPALELASQESTFSSQILLVLQNEYFKFCQTKILHAI